MKTMTEQLAATAVVNSAQLDPNLVVSSAACPGMPMGEALRTCQGAGYLPVRRTPATWRGFAGGVWAIPAAPAIAVRKHIRGLSTWGPPV